MQDSDSLQEEILNINELDETTENIGFQVSHGDRVSGILISNDGEKRFKEIAACAGSLLNKGDLLDRTLNICQNSARRANGATYRCTSLSLLLSLSFGNSVTSSLNPL